jgi:hypothetical protein
LNIHKSLPKPVDFWASKKIKRDNTPKRSRIAIWHYYVKKEGQAWKIKSEREINI